MIILLLIYIALVALFASEEARADAIDIRNGKPIRHADAWKERACVAAFGALIVSAMHLFWVWGLGVFLWHFAGLCVVAYGAFTVVFRWKLNRLRGMDWRYISPSSAYDRVFIRACSGEWLGLKEEIQYHEHWYNVGTSYSRTIHRAGTWAYAVEGLALLIGCAITLDPWK